MAEANGIVVSSTVILTSIGRVRSIPGLIVQRAVLRLRDVVLVQHVGVEKGAELGLAGRGRVGEVVVGLRGAGCGAEVNVEGAGLEDADAHVGVVAVAV